MLDMFFNKDPRRELEKLHDQEQAFIKKIEAINDELSSLESPDADFDETANYGELAAKVTSLRNEIQGYKTALVHIGRSRAKNCSVLDEQAIKESEVKLRKMKEEQHRVSKEIDSLQPKLHELKTTYTDLATKMTAWTPPLEFWGRDWTIERLREVMDSPLCPFVDRDRIKQIVRDYDEFTSKSDYFISPKVTVDERGVITNVFEDPAEGLKNPHFFKPHEPFMPNAK
jgi:prefoldin subunit 5